MTDFTLSFCQSFLVSEVCNLTSQQIFPRVSLSLVTVPTHEIDQVLTLSIWDIKMIKPIARLIIKRIPCIAVDVTDVMSLDRSRSEVATLSLANQ